MLGPVVSIDAGNGAQGNAELVFYGGTPSLQYDGLIFVTPALNFGAFFPPVVAVRGLNVTLSRSPAIGGPGVMRLVGSGAANSVLILTGNNSSWGSGPNNAIVIQAATLQGSTSTLPPTIIAGGDPAGNQGLLLVNQGVIIGTQTFTYQDNIGSSSYVGAPMAIRGTTGSVTLTSNHHTGGTTLSSGTTVMSTTSSFGTGAVTISSYLDEPNPIWAIPTNTALTCSNNVVINSGCSVNMYLPSSNTYPLTLSGGLSASGTMNITGGGELIITGNSTLYTGQININSGTLALSGSGQIINAGVNYNNLSATSATFSIASASGNVSLSYLSSTPGSIGDSLVLGNNSLILNTSGVTSCDAAITGNGGIIMNGTGTLLLTGGSGSTYSGGTTLNSGTLQHGSTASLGSGAVTLAGGTLEFIHSVTYFYNPITLSGNGNILVDTGISFIPSGIISGCSLTIGGAGIFDFYPPNTNTYSGGTTYAGSGILLVTSPPNLGSGPLSLTGSGTLQVGASGGYPTQNFSMPLNIMGNGTILNNGTFGSTVTFSGPATGTGNITFNMFFTTTNLTGPATYSGTTTITAGKLLLSGTTGQIALPGLIALQSTSILSFLNSPSNPFIGGLSDSVGSSQVILPPLNVGSPSNAIIITGIAGSSISTPTVYSGTITDSSSGLGVVSVIGGVQRFSGNNTYGSLTEISNGGTLMVSTVSNLGLNFSNNAILMTGSSPGTLYMLAGSAQTWNGSLSFSGASGVLFAATGASWNFAGSISNPSAAIIRGGGTIYFNGTIKALGPDLSMEEPKNLASSLRIEGGNLVVNSDLSVVPVHIESQGTLRGKGKVGGVKNNGRLIITAEEALVIEGNYEMLEDGITDIALDAQGKGAHLVVKGSATLGGALVITTTAHPKNYKGLTCPVLSVEGDLSGQFNEVVMSQGRLKAELIYPASYNGFSVSEGGFLHVQFSVAPLVAENLSTFNTRSVAGNLTSIETSSGGFGTDTDLESIYELLETQTSAQNQYALDKMQPSQISAFADVEAYVGSAILSMMHTPAYRCNPGKGIEVWLQPYGAWAKQQPFQDQMGFDLDNRGLAYGASFQATKGFSFGLGGAYDRSTVRWHHHQQKGDRTANYGGFYADYSTHTFHLGVATLVGLDSYDVTRKIQFASINRRAKSHSEGFDVMSQFTASLNLGKKAWNFSPYMNIDYFYINQGMFHEHGAESLDLKVFRHDSSTLRTELGAQIKPIISFHNGCFAPILGLAWVRQTPLSRPEYRARFDEQTLSFRVKGWNHVWNLAAPYAGFELSFGDFNLSGEYEIEAGDGFFGQKANFRMAWNF